MPATLIHAPLACSLAARFAAAEGNVPLRIEPVDLASKQMASGQSLFDFNPLGQVSVLRLEDGSQLTETSVCIAWIQAQSGVADFRRDPDDPQYFQMLRWLGFCATELHKQIFRVVFYPEATDEVKDRVRQLAPQRFQLLDQHLSEQPYLLGESISAADAYLAWFFVLAERAQVDPGEFRHLADYQERVLTRPAIAQALAQDREMINGR